MGSNGLKCQVLSPQPEPHYLEQQKENMNQVLCFCTERTAITRHPVDQHISEEEEVVFHCEAASDPSTPVTVSWDKEGIPITTNQVSTLYYFPCSLALEAIAIAGHSKLIHCV